MRSPDLVSPMCRCWSCNEPILAVGLIPFFFMTWTHSTIAAPELSIQFNIVCCCQLPVHHRETPAVLLWVESSCRQQPKSAPKIEVHKNQSNADEVNHQNIVSYQNETTRNSRWSLIGPPEKLLFKHQNRDSRRPNLISRAALWVAAHAQSSPISCLEQQYLHHPSCLDNVIVLNLLRTNCVRLNKDGWVYCRISISSCR